MGFKVLVSIQMEERSAKNTGDLREFVENWKEN
jgi:hypothetical protein